jgi:hypothetical protein
VGNPNFQISANPGNVTISGSGPGIANLLLTPGPGLGFTGVVALSCSGLPTGSTCGFIPAQPTLDGFTPLTVTLSITKPAALAAAIRRTPYDRARSLLGALGGGVLASAFLFAWPRKKRPWRLAAFLVLTGLTGAMSGCQSIAPGGSSVGSGGTSSNAFVATVTASGGTGAQAVSHSVTLAVTVR